MRSHNFAFVTVLWSVSEAEPEAYAQASCLFDCVDAISTNWVLNDSTLHSIIIIEPIALISYVCIFSEKIMWNVNKS